MKEFKPQGFEAMMIEYLIKQYEEAELKQMKGVNKGCQTRDNIVIDTAERTFHIEIRVRGYKRGEIPASVVLGDTVEEHVRNPGAGSPFMVSPVLDVSNAPIPFNMPRPPSKEEIEEANRQMRRRTPEGAREAVREAERDFDRMIFDQALTYGVVPPSTIKELPDIEAKQRELIEETKRAKGRSPFGVPLVPLALERLMKFYEEESENEELGSG